MPEMTAKVNTFLTRNSLTYLDQPTEKRNEIGPFTDAVKELQISFHKQNIFLVSSVFEEV